MTKFQVTFKLKAVNKKVLPQKQYVGDQSYIACYFYNL